MHSLAVMSDSGGGSDIRPGSGDDSSSGSSSEAPVQPSQAAGSKSGDIIKSKMGCDFSPRG